MDVDPHQLFGEGLHEEGKNHRPDIDEKLAQTDLRESEDEDADGKEDENQEGCMHILRLLNNISYLF